VLAGQFKLAAFVLNLVEEPHVLDRNHCLVGEGGCELDLFLGEGSYLRTLQDKHTDRERFAQQRNGQHAVCSGHFLDVAASIFRIGQHVRNLDGPPFQHCSPKHRPAVGHDRMLAHIRAIFARHSPARDIRKRVALRTVESCGIGVAEQRGRLHQRIEHRLQIEGRAADHLERVGGGGLLLQRLTQIVRALAQLVEQADILDGDDGLRGEVRDQLDLLVGERAHLLAIDHDRANHLVLLKHSIGLLAGAIGLLQLLALDEDRAGAVHRTAVQCHSHPAMIDTTAAIRAAIATTISHNSLDGHLMTHRSPWTQFSVRAVAG
jgi:hypothetical protein